MHVLQLEDYVANADFDPGFLSEAIAEKVDPTETVLGIKIFPDVVAKSRSFTPPPDLPNAEECAQATSAGDADFDTVVSTQVAEHIEETDALLAEFKRILCPGGRVMMITTDWSCVG